VQRVVDATRFIATSRSQQQQQALQDEMDRVLSWEAFHVNRVAQLSDRQPLLLVGLTALNHFGLLHAFGIKQECAVNFLRAVEHHYMCAPRHFLLPAPLPACRCALRSLQTRLQPQSDASPTCRCRTLNARCVRCSALPAGRRGSSTVTRTFAAPPSTIHADPNAPCARAGRTRTTAARTPRT
jgi:hypothetical protein